MNEQEKTNLLNIIKDIETTKEIIPTFSDLCLHPLFGGVFQSMQPSQQELVNVVIKEYIQDKVLSLKKTKGGQLFRRFVEGNPELFWRFRELNENEESTQCEEFQRLGKQVESELFKLEGILTDKMLNQEKGLDQVMGSFYRIVYLFFPRYNNVE